MDPCTCAEHAETFWSLFQSGPHWAFELFLEALSRAFGVAVWPIVHKTWKKYIHRHNECCVPQPEKSTRINPLTGNPISTDPRAYLGPACCGCYFWQESQDGCGNHQSKEHGRWCPANMNACDKFEPKETT